MLLHDKSQIRIAWANSVGSDLRCASRVYFDNVTRRHRNHANTVTSAIAAKQTVTRLHNKHCYKWSLGGFNKISHIVVFYWKKNTHINFINSVEINRILIGGNPHATVLIFLTPLPAYKMQLFHTYESYYALQTSKAWFWNWAENFKFDKSHGICYITKSITISNDHLKVAENYF